MKGEIYTGKITYKWLKKMKVRFVTVISAKHLVSATRSMFKYILGKYEVEDTEMEEVFVTMISAKKSVWQKKGRYILYNKVVLEMTKGKKYLSQQYLIKWLTVNGNPGKALSHAVEIKMKTRAITVEFPKYSVMEVNTLKQNCEFRIPLLKKWKWKVYWFVLDLIKHQYRNGSGPWNKLLSLLGICSHKSLKLLAMKRL